jgi:hypothetical protein
LKPTGTYRTFAYGREWRFDGAMPRDPFVREKFTRERTAAKKLAAEYFDRFPKKRVPDRSRELAPSAIAKHRIHHEAAARADREGDGDR